MRCILSVLTKDRNARLWLVLRHGEKAPWDLHNSFEETTLSERGMKDSFEFGVILKEAGLTLSQLGSSPLPRCIQTCDNIAKSYGLDITVHSDNILAYPGSLSPQDSQENISLENTTREKTISGNNAQRADRCPSEGIRNVLGTVLNKPCQGHKIGLFVTHDAIIAPILTFLTDEIFDPKTKWIGYLDGFGLCHTEGYWIVINGHGGIYDVSSQIQLLTDGFGCLQGHP